MSNGDPPRMKPSPLEPSYSTPFPSRFAASPSSAFTQSPLRAMLIDQRDGLVSHHAPRRASVLQHVYRRMRPEEIVRMSPGDEIIVVIPAPRPKSRADTGPLLSNREQSLISISSCFLRSLPIQSRISPEIGC